MDEVFGSDDDSIPEQQQQQPVAPPANATATEEDLFGSDSEGEADESKPAAPASSLVANQEQEDLFGSDEDDEAKGADMADMDQGDGTKQKEDLDGLFGSDDEVAPVKKQVHTQSELSLPVLKKTLPAGGFAVSGTMPKFVKIQPRPYVKGDILEEEENNIFAGATDMIRWRYKTDSAGSVMRDSSGRPMRESNARLVKWSDGTFQLLVGSTVFNAEMVPIHDSFGYVQLKSEEVEKSADSADDIATSAKSKKHTSCLNCVGKIENKVQILPPSVDSEVHAKLSYQVSKSYQSGTSNRQIAHKHYSTMKQDPEKEMEERSKAEELELRKKRKLTESSGGSSKKKFSAMSARYLEDGEDEGNYDSASLSHLKRGGAAKRRSGYGSSGDDSDGGRRYASQSARRKVDKSDKDPEMDDFIVDDEEEDGSDEYDAEFDSPQKGRIQKKHGDAGRAQDDDEDMFEEEEAVDDDSDDETGGAAMPSKAQARSKRMVIDSDEDD